MAPGPEHLFAEWTNSHAYPEPCLLNIQRSVRDARFKLIRNLMPDRRNPAELYYTDQVLVKSGADADEVATAHPHVQAAHATWRDLPAVELYDLQTDPHEWCNLADDPACAETREHLLGVLESWQRETGDMLADPELRERFIAETAAATACGGVRKNPDFTWDYPEYLEPPSA
jgi:hypothetical protein